MTVVNERVLPAPDVSSIDLASLLSADDLSDWLREVAERSATPDTERKVQSTTGEQAVEAVRSHAESESEIEANSVTQPWWTSDRIMAGLLIAVVLTILFVLITTIRLG